MGFVVVACFEPQTLRAVHARRRSRFGRANRRGHRRQIWGLGEGVERQVNFQYSFAHTRSRPSELSKPFI
eukprot:5637145-Prymnesium_polylepis.1